ncbi:hypothetical protein BGX27_010526 [Mortierella sp. AM989]|nr:hypothetical protein BGX27_010526 [Mortierella sp. AM989]
MISCCTICRSFPRLALLKLHSTGYRTRTTSAPSIFNCHLFSLSFLVLLLTIIPTTIQSQPQPNVFTPRHSAGSAIVNRILYVVAGSSSITSIQPIADLISLPLDSPFSTDTAPWKSLRSGYKVGDARAAANDDETKLVMVGMGDNDSPLASVYDIKHDEWDHIPQTAGVFTQTPRISAGVALDSLNGIVVVFGGFSYGVVSGEMDLLDSRKHDYSEWTWSIASAQNQFIPLYQPIVVYSPKIRATLIMGGCTTYNPYSGPSNPQPFNVAYVVSNILEATGAISVNTAKTTLKGYDPSNSAGGATIPSVRLSPCFAVLDNGDVFMYSGSMFNIGLNDAWVLHVSNFTWSPVTIKNAPQQGRAGATCQLVTPNQLIVVGGYTGPITVPSGFAEPQVGIIKTDDWTWTSNFIADTTNNNNGLPQSAVLGLGVGGGLLLSAIMFFMGFFFRKKYSSNQKTNNRQSESRDDLLGNPTNENDLDSTKRLLSTPLTSRSNQLVDSKSLPLIIMPYSPTETTVVSASPPVKPVKQQKANDIFPPSERLTHNMADKQQGFYTKAAQHTKYYERSQNQNPNLNAINTQQLYLTEDESPEDLNLATTILNLEEVRTGEEPFEIPMRTLGTGVMLISEHVDPSRPVSGHADFKPVGYHEPGTPHRPISRPFGTSISPGRLSSTFMSNNTPPSTGANAYSPSAVNLNSRHQDNLNVASIPGKHEIEDDDDEYYYVPGRAGRLSDLPAIRAANSASKSDLRI